jgi:hypothetical protein
MKSHSLLRRLLAVACLLGFAGSAAFVRAEAPVPPPKGLRILTAGHSFHVWMPGILIELAKHAQITGHQQVALSSIGGSQTIQHWNVPDDKNQIKPALIGAKADVLTLAPVYLPDEGIENFVKLGLEHNPDLRITVQEFWLPFDEVKLWATRAKGVTIDRDAKTMTQLRDEHAPYFKSMDDLVSSLNTKYGKNGKSPVFVVPSGQAVLALREKVIKGEVPGVSKQSELFTDPVGHPRDHIKMLAAYCHYAVIYGRSPVGLPVPALWAKSDYGEKLTRVLQETAWDAVIHHPLSGVTAAVAVRPK